METDFPEKIMLNQKLKRPTNASRKRHVQRATGTLGLIDACVGACVGALVDTFAGGFAGLESLPSSC